MTETGAAAVLGSPADAVFGPEPKTALGLVGVWKTGGMATFFCGLPFAFFPPWIYFQKKDNNFQPCKTSYGLRRIGSVVMFVRGNNNGFALMS